MCRVEFDTDAKSGAWFDELFKSKPGNFYQQGIENLVEHWEVVNCNEEYIIYQLVVFSKVLFQHLNKKKQQGLSRQLNIYVCTKLGKFSKFSHFYKSRLCLKTMVFNTFAAKPRKSTF